MAPLSFLCNFVEAATLITITLSSPNVREMGLVVSGTLARYHREDHDDAVTTRGNGS